MKFKNAIAIAAISASAVLGLAACTSSSHKCIGNECDVHLNGEGANTTLGNEETEVALVSANGGSATFTVDGKRLTCKVGDKVNFGTTKITCEKIGDSEIELHFSL